MMMFDKIKCLRDFIRDFDTTNVLLYSKRVSAYIDVHMCDVVLYNDYET